MHPLYLKPEYCCYQPQQSILQASQSMHHAHRGVSLEILHLQHSSNFFDERNLHPPPHPTPLPPSLPPPPKKEKNLSSYLKKKGMQRKNPPTKKPRKLPFSHQENLTDRLDFSHPSWKLCFLSFFFFFPFAECVHSTEGLDFSFSFFLFKKGQQTFMAPSCQKPQNAWGCLSSCKCSVFL